MGWELVGYASEPIPDDPGVVASQVEHLRAVAGSIDAQLQALPSEGNLEALEWDSDAALGFRRVVTTLPHDLAALKTRYAKVATALEAFNRTLVDAKALAHEGLADAKTATDAVNAAQAGVAAMKNFAAQAAQGAALANQSAPPGTPRAVAQTWTGPDHRAALAGASEAWGEPRTRSTTPCAGSSRPPPRPPPPSDAVDDILKDDHSFFGHIKRAAHWLAERLPLAARSGLLAKVSAVLGVLALIVAVIPVIQVVAPVLEGIALAMAGVVLLCDLVLAANEAYEGTAEWHNAAIIGIDAVALATGGVAVLLRGPARLAGRAATTAGREAAAARRAVRAATATRVAAQSDVAGKAARVEQLRSGRIMPVVNRALGRTGRAEAQLASSKSALAAASDAERHAVAAAQASQAQAAAASRSAAEAHAVKETWSRAGAVWGVDGAGSAVLHSEPELASRNPAKAVVVSTEHEWQELVHFRGAHSALAEAGEAGGAIPARLR